MSLLKKTYLYVLALHLANFELASGKKNEPSIIIIGAGAAGIAAAANLFENGFKKVTILEAERRIGGRIRTTQFYKYLVDLGAQYVYPGSVDCTSALPWPTELMENQYTDFEYFTVYDSSGTQMHDNWIRDLKKIFKREDIDMPIFKNSEKSVGEHFEGRIWKIINGLKRMKDKEELIEFILMMKSANFGADIKQVSPKNYREKGQTYGPLRGWKTRGYSTILNVLMKRYSNATEELPVINNTILNTEVSLIKSNLKDGKVLVKTTDGDTHRADHVIVTIPLGVLKEKYNTLFHPPLPKRKIKTIQGLGYSNQEKIFLFFDKPFWNLTLLEENGFNLYWEENDKAILSCDPERNWLLGLSQFMLVESKPKLLMTQVFGKYAQGMNKLSDQQVLNHIVRVLRKFFGQDYYIAEPIKMIRSTWNTNKHFRGSWTYYKEKEPSDDEVFCEDLAEPIGEPKPKILFAGEATHPQMFGSVQGAIFSGYREAYRLIKYHGREKTYDYYSQSSY